MMHTYGARCIASPSTETNAGRQILKKDPNCAGSLGIAISEAIEMAAPKEDTKYSLGSVLNHVLMHQTIDGNEALMQMEMTGNYPDVVIGCTGGGSNFSGLVFPFLGQQLRGGQKINILACEPRSCPSITKGKYAYDFGDTGHLAPLVKMHTLGSTFIPPATHSGGLRYHGMAPMVSHLVDLGLIQAKAYGQKECFDAGVIFANAEGVIPAPEATNAVNGTIETALECKKKGESQIILFNLSGHGNFDMTAYSDYFENKLADDFFEEDLVKNALSELPNVA